MASETNVSCQSSRNMIANVADECDYRSKDVGETFVVDRLDRL